MLAGAGRFMHPARKSPARGWPKGGAWGLRNCVAVPQAHPGNAGIDLSIRRLPKRRPPPGIMPYALYMQAMLAGRLMQPAGKRAPPEWGSELRSVQTWSCLTPKMSSNFFIPR